MDSGDTAAPAVHLPTSCAGCAPTTPCCRRRASRTRAGFTSDRVWIVDPLDGTNEYGEPGRHDWAVHIALWATAGFLAAAVSLPAIGMVFATDPAPSLPAGRARAPSLVTSRNRAPYAAVIVANALDAEAVRLGSAGAKAMAVVHRRGRHLRPRRRDVPVGLRGAGRRRRSPPACTSAASTARRSSTTSATRGCPTSSSAARSSPSPCSMRCGATAGGARRDDGWHDWQRWRGAEGDPVRGRRPRRDGVAAPPAPPQRVDRADARRVPLDPRRARRRRAVRAVVVTGTPPAFCVGGDSEALAGHAERGGYDDGLPASWRRPGYGVRPEFDHDFAFQFAMRFPIIAAVNGAVRRHRAGPRPVLRPPLRRRPRPR